jgi:hypothetical protein
MVSEAVLLEDIEETRVKVETLSPPVLGKETPSNASLARRPYPFSLSQHRKYGPSARSWNA